MFSAVSKTEIPKDFYLTSMTVSSCCAVANEAIFPRQGFLYDGKALLARLRASSF